MAKKKFTIVEIEYDADQYWNNYDEKVQKIAKRFKAEERGAGTGFGVRDMSFDVPTKDCAAFKKACRNLKYVTSVKTRLEEEE